MAENTYVLYNEARHACIIDPGCYFPAEKNELENFIADNDLHVKLLLLTHAHLDHVFGLNHVAHKYHLTPMLHPKEQVVLERGPDMAAMYGMPFPAYIGPATDLADGSRVLLEDDVLEVIYAPGHSPGHVCFYCKAQDFVIGGDVLFQRSIGRTDLPGGNHQTLINSIKTRLFSLPDATVVYSGHGPSTTIGEEKTFNPFLTWP